MGYTAAKTGAMGPYNPFYHYWNPWWEDTFIVSSKSPYMTLGPYQYEWYRHGIIFNKVTMSTRMKTQ